VATGSELAVLRGHDGWIRAMAWSPNGRWLATGSVDSSIRLWDARDGHQHAVLRGHDDWVQSVAWSPDGRRLVTESADRTVRIWIASSSQDGTARVWDATISIDELVASACRRVSRELTAEERRNLMLSKRLDPWHPQPRESDDRRPSS
jgi:WD40 repeat protein